MNTRTDSSEDIINLFETCSIVSSHHSSNLSNQLKILLKNDTTLEPDSPLDLLLDQIFEESDLKSLRLAIEWGLDFSLYKKFPLHKAVRSSQVEILRLLLSQKSLELNQKDDQGQSALCYAVQCGNLEMVELLINAGVDVNFVDDQASTALHYVNYDNGDKITTKLIEMLLQRNTNGFAVDDKSISALFLATISDYNLEYAKRIELFYRYAGDYRLDDLGNELFSILENGDLQTLKFILDKGIDLADFKVRFPLHRAAHNPRIEVLKYLLDSGHFDSNETDTSGRVALQSAVCCKNLEAIKLLFNSGARIDTNEVLESFLVCDVDCRDRREIVTKCIEILLQNGADGCTRDENGDSLIDVSTRLNYSSEYTKRLELFLKFADVEKLNIGNLVYEVFRNVLFFGDLLSVQLMIKHGVDLVNHAPELPLQSAAFNPDVEVLQFLLSTGHFDIKQRNEDGVTALRDAVGYNHLDAIDLLLKSGVDSNSLDELGQNFLQCINYEGSSRNTTLCIKILLENGTDVNAGEHEGKSPLDFSVKSSYSSEYTRRLRLLFQYGAKWESEDSAWNKFEMVLKNGDLSAVQLFLDNGIDLAKCPKQMCISNVIKNNPRLRNVEIHSITSVCQPEEIIEDVESNNLNINAALKCEDNSKLNSHVNELFTVLENGDLETLQSILDQGIDILYYEVRLPLHRAALNPRIEVLQYLLSMKLFDVNQTNPCGEVALCYAATSNNLAVMKLLFDSGARLDIIDTIQRTILHHIDYNDNSKIRTKCIEFLLQHGVDGLAKDVLGYSAFFRAADSEYHSEYTRRIELFIKFCDNIKFNDQMFTIFSRILKRGDLPSVKLMIKNGIDLVKYATEFPLHEASTNSNIEILNFLLSTGYFDVNQRDNITRTALGIAVNCKNLGAVKLLIKSGAEVNLVDGDGMNSLHCVKYDENSEITTRCIEILLKHGADGNAEDHKGWSPLYYSAIARYSSEYTKRLQLFLQYRNNPTPTNFNNDPFRAILMYGGLQDVQLFLKHSHNFTKSPYSTYSFPATAANHRLEVMEFFLSLGIFDPGQVYEIDGSTALHVAALGKNPGTMRLVLECGVEVDPVDKDGNTPLQIVASNQNNPSSVDTDSDVRADCIEMLLFYGADIHAKSLDSR
ncbi:hypothetical protein QAD02_006374 [Eretmocerus hayati]|uniref:Uncharacterized protein n=1 Tax=Eretmocerus hayati TaxID=131215 RepID=A0ACC2N0T0_9HYME|nr:hypothetical protein QAD02_006374 [Eretmocerus hayati]